MQLLRRDTYLGAEAEHAAVREGRRGVRVDRRRVDLVQEALNRRGTLRFARVRHDGLRVHRAVAVHVGNGLVDARDALHRDFGT